MGVQVLTNCSPAQQLTRPATDCSDNKIFTCFMLQDGGIHEADLVIYVIRIKPRDALALAIGECASWKGNY